MNKLISTYQVINKTIRAIGLPLFIYTPCRHYPSCSEYAQMAIKKNGTLKGSLQAIGRVCRCNPWTKGGVDYPK